MRLLLAAIFTFGAGVILHFASSDERLARIITEERGRWLDHRGERAGLMSYPGSAYLRLTGRKSGGGESFAGRVPSVRIHG